MKKLTAGIFATLLAVVSADSAYAAIASKGYVDEQVGTKADASTVTSLQGTVSTLQTTVGQHATQIASKADSSTVTALQTEVDGKQDALGFTPEDSANKTTTLSGTSTDTQYPSAKAVWDTIQTETTGIASDADVTALEGRVGTLETASKTHATKTELTEGLAAKANTADLGALATLNAVGSTQITDGAVATADIADKAVTEAKLSDTVNASLDRADSALQQAALAPYQTKVAADAAYAVKALEDQVGDVSATNMGTTATTVVTAIKEVAEEAADAASAASAADTKAGQAQTAATKAQGEVDALEGVVNHETTGLAAAHTAIDALESGKLDKTATAARATADASGNVITTTYATKAEIANMATDENLKLKQDKTDNSLATTNKTVVGAINEVKTTADDASTAAGAAQTAADEAQADATQALADAATAQGAAEAAQATAETKQDKLTGTIGGSMQPVYLNDGTITAGTALGTLATKSTVTNSEVADGALAQSKISGLATSLAAKLTTPPTSAKGESGLYVLTYDGTDFQWEDIARTVE